MPSLEFFVVCRNVSMDVETDEVTLANVIEDVYLDEDGKAFLSQAAAVSSWNLGEGDTPTDSQTILRITRPGETEGSDFSTNLQIGRHRYRGISVVTDIPLDKPGLLLFELFLNAKHAAGHTVIVHPPEARIHEGMQLAPKNEKGTGQVGRIKKTAK